MTDSFQTRRLPAQGDAGLDQKTDERILSHLAFARAVARRSLSPKCTPEDREDLLAWGVVGLVQAARRYREGGRASFAAFAARRIRGQVLDALRDADPLPRAARREWRAHGRRNDPFPIQSLDDWIDRGRETFRPLRAEPASASARDPRWGDVRRALGLLSALERRVLVLHFQHGLTLREIGLRVGLSESGVCRVRARALAKLRRSCVRDDEGDVEARGA
ncbi:MAG TPA: sigma-70 family RNA polymerase sigma factor [Candidatus Limnocylindria bacterium]|nr:sigma-70 family RNA polymerase sigma factor [Candidatus Limnocylindria bacterium]